MRRERLVPIKIDSYKPLREVVFESLREAIINQLLRPGERLMEIQLAEELGVSRTPIREAIRMLEQEGLVIIIPRKGAHVAEISLRDIHEVYEIRAALEALACGLAAERATNEEIEEMEKFLVKETESLTSTNLMPTVDADVGLHDIIYKAARNERLLGMLSNLREQIYRLRVASMAYPGRKKKTLDEHRNIIEAISERNIDLAQRAAQKHIELAENAMLEVIKARKQEQ